MIFVILQQILFVAALGLTAYLVFQKIKVITANIRLGKPEARYDQPNVRLKNMLLLAFGQKKMFQQWKPAALHFLIYAGFLLINIEILEIVLDGIFGTHRLFLPFLGGAYPFIISFFELLAVGVLVSCGIFMIRRNVTETKRFKEKEMQGWAAKDGNYILIIEIVLMAAILLMNASDLALQNIGYHPEKYHPTGAFLVSGFIAPLLEGLPAGILVFIERLSWWAHILGIFAFSVYIPDSKHLHIALAFPNAYFGDLDYTQKGKMKNMPKITEEVQLMMNPDAPMPEEDPDAEPEKFGAKDVTDLTWKNLLDAYSCTECGRCTMACPANQTGKLLSPRKIMMDTRDRLEELGQNLATHGKDHDDGKSLIHDYISTEEIKACTACNACVQECPVSINPLNIILELRRYLILEEADSPEEWNLMFSNIENNGAVWQFSPEDRDKWVTEL